MPGKTVRARRTGTLALFLIAVLVLAPVRFDSFTTQKTQADWWEEMGYTVLRGGNHVWHKADDLLFRGVVLLDDATLTIERGATVRFTQGGDIYIPVFRVMSGRVIAEGSRDEKITFKAETEEDQFGLAFQGNPESVPSFFRHVVISGGGYATGYAFESSTRTWKNTAVAATRVAAVGYYSGRVHFENSEIVDSRTSAVEIAAYIGAENPDDFFEIANSNFEDSADGKAVASDLSCDETIGNCRNRILLKNNWYGDSDGPSGAVASDATDGESVTGRVYLDGWRKNRMIADPLLVIPGITGSAMTLGDWKMDPILHTYDDLLGSLENNGYEKDRNLFTFPYDWRVTNKTSALYLQEKIGDVMQKTRSSKVDVVAHSMGGLVTRAYVEEIEGTQYADTIDQLITLGTPHRGSPEAYLKWEAGEGFFTIKESLAKHHFTQEAEEAGYDDLHEYIRDKVPSIGELLPDSDYISDLSSGVSREYPDGYPRNGFLEDLNAEQNKTAFEKINYTSIIGTTGLEQTISKIRVVGSSINGKWEDGMPENFYDPETDRGLEFGKGDETVPEESAKGILADKTIEILATHNELPTKAQCEIFRELTGVQECNYDEDIHIPNILLFNVFSPVDIQVVSPSGWKVGVDFEGDGFLNEIPGAYYTGSDTKNEFITIPNPEDGEYTILARGTGDGGAYRIEMTKIAETADGGATESTATIEGEAVVGAMEEDMTVAVSADTVELKETKDVVPPTVAIASPEEIAYSNDAIIPVSYEATDDVSLKKDLAVAVALNSATYTEPTIDSSLLPLGTHTLSVSATDEAGNTGTMTNDFTLETSWDALLENIDHYATLGFFRNKGERQMLKTHIRNLGETVEFLETYDIFFRQHPRLRDIFEREIAHQLSILQKHVNQRSGKSIDPTAATRLVESMEFLKDSL